MRYDLDFDIRQRNMNWCLVVLLNHFLNVYLKFSPFKTPNYLTDEKTVTFIIKINISGFNKIFPSKEIWIIDFGPLLTPFIILKNYFKDKRSPYKIIKNNNAFLSQFSSPVSFGANGNKTTSMPMLHLQSSVYNSNSISLIA